MARRHFPCVALRARPDSVNICWVRGVAALACLQQLHCRLGFCHSRLRRGIKLHQDRMPSSFASAIEVGHMVQDLDIVGCILCVQVGGGQLLLPHLLVSLAGRVHALNRIAEVGSLVFQIFQVLQPT